MRTTAPDLRPVTRAFTLIEILVVIAIIVILAALIAPVVIGSIEKKKIAVARLEIARMVAAIEQYQSAYGRPPGTTAAADVTYGGPDLGIVLGPGNWTSNHSDVVAILMDLEKDGLGNPTVNDKHVKNPRRDHLLPATMVGSTNEPGVGPDLVCRDPWGNPYVISIDANHDDRCSDALYGRRVVSQQNGPTGFDGLHNTDDPGGAGDHFQFHGVVMVWSFGPDGKADKDRPANAGMNKDNVRSWK